MQPSEQAVAELEAIDRTLAGEPVAPAHAELAELALLLAMGRPQIEPHRAASLDARFAALGAQREGRAARFGWPRGAGWAARRRARRADGSPSWGPVLLRPAWGAGLVAVAAVAAVVAVVVGVGGVAGVGVNSPASQGAGGTRYLTARPGSATSAAGASAAPAGAGRFDAPAPSPSAASNETLSRGSAAVRAPAAKNPAQTLAAGGAQSPATPVPSGRKTIQSSQLALSAPNDRIETVSQEVFDVVGAESGVVENSQVTAAVSGGSASFTLEIPAANLSAAVARLSQLRYAAVASASGSTTDVNSQYQDDVRALADARALRTSLLRQLETAPSQTAIDSLQTQIQDTESSIASDERTVNALNGQIAYSRLSVQISPAQGTAHPAAHGFTLRRAVHDAVRVLTVVAGIALIVLAVLLPLGSLVVLARWVALARRRRGREAALDRR